MRRFAQKETTRMHVCNLRCNTLQPHQTAEIHPRKKCMFMVMVPCPSFTTAHLPTLDETESWLDFPRQSLVCDSRSRGRLALRRKLLLQAWKRSVVSCCQGAAVFRLSSPSHTGLCGRLVLFLLGLSEAFCADRENLYPFDDRPVYLRWRKTLKSAAFQTSGRAQHMNTPQILMICAVGRIVSLKVSISCCKLEFSNKTFVDRKSSKALDACDALPTIYCTCLMTCHAHWTHQDGPSLAVSKRSMPDASS